MRPTTGRLCQTIAVSIATILGTGILGLPVSLHASGLRPFFVTFTVNFFVQIGVVFAMVEILQRANCKPYPSGYQPLEADSETELPAQQPPSLHSLAESFIPHAPLRAIFNAVVLLHFLFILTAYALAGPQAYTTLFPIITSAPRLLPPIVFVVSCALLVVCLSHALLPSLTVGTFVKAALLTLLVCLTLFRGLAIHRHISNDWALSKLIDPFLMGTIALSGVVNLMPVTFQACLDGVPPGTDIDHQFISYYRAATIFAVALCYVLNIAWSIGVLLVVPQFSTESLSNTGNPQGAQMNVSLTTADELGEISTVPLIQVLQSRGDALDGIVALLVNLFIAISVTISFLVMSVGMKHYIDGTVADSQTAHSRNEFNRNIKYLVCFCVILATALTNPKGLIKIMEGTTTLALNVEAGLFVVYMMYTSRTSDFRTSIPSPLSDIQATALTFFVGIYFIVAIFVDIVFYIPSIF